MEVLAASKRRPRGDGMEELVSKLKAEEAQRGRLAAELAQLADLEKVVSLDTQRVKKQLTARAAEMQSLLGDRTPETRQLLRRVVQDRITCEPFREDGTIGYRYTVRATFSELLSGSTSCGVPDRTGAPVDAGNQRRPADRIAAVYSTSRA